MIYPEKRTTVRAFIEGERIYTREFRTANPERALNQARKDEHFPPDADLIGVWDVDPNQGSARIVTRKHGKSWRRE